MPDRKSVIVIKGNDLKKAEILFKSFRYFDLQSDKSYPKAEEALFYINTNFSKLIDEEDVVLRGIWADDHFTYYYDPEMTDATDEDALEELAKKINTEVYAFIIDEVSATYEFAKYTNKGQTRYFSISGKDLFNDGDPLPEENGLSLGKNTGIADIVQLATNLGIDIGFKSIPAPFRVKELGYNEDL